jgi:C1A family cysteine protease
MDRNRLNSMGWERDLPDFRDFRAEAPEVEKVLAKSALLKAIKKGLPTSVNLRKWCSPVEDQGELGSCTANAGVGLLEYFERRAFGKHLDASRLFLYKITRNLLGWKGDQGAYLRSTMKSMVLFGIPPEKHWPYDISRFDEEPTTFCYAFAGNYKSIQYYRLDPSGTPAGGVLSNVKDFLAAGLPSMFGFSVYSSIPGTGEGTGDIPFPESGDRLEGGHAVVAVGYDDAKNIGKDKGALLIRNSWGVDWGEKGYGWLPYAYVEQGLAVDFWTLVKAEFVNTNLFK